MRNHFTRRSDRKNAPYKPETELTLGASCCPDTLPHLCRSPSLPSNNDLVQWNPRSPVPRDLGLHSSFAGQLRLESFPGSCHTFSRPNSGLGSFHFVSSPVLSLGSDLYCLLMPYPALPTPLWFSFSQVHP